MAGGIGYRGRNRYQEFLKASKAISRKVGRIPGVVGILATGGVGRRRCDDLSDLDLIVYARESRCREIERFVAVGGLRHKGIELDTPVASFDRALRHKSPSAYWSQVRRWDRQNSRILFDPGGKVKNLLKAKLVFPEPEQKRLMARHARKVNDFFIYDFAIWSRRGRPHNLAHVLLQGTEHLILWIYARNRQFQPYLPKWLFYHLETGRVPESRYFATLRKPFTAPITTAREAGKIRDELVDLCGKLEVPFGYHSVREIHEEEVRNWDRASEKTRRYLGW